MRWVVSDKNKVFLFTAMFILVLGSCRSNNWLNAYNMSGNWESLPSTVGGKMMFMFDVPGHSYQLRYTEKNGQVTTGERRSFFVVNDSVIALNGKGRPYWRKVRFLNDGRLEFLYYEAKLREDIELSYEYEYQRVK